MEHTLEELVDLAIKKLDPWRERLVTRRLRRKPEAIYAHICEQLCADADCREIVAPAVAGLLDLRSAKFDIDPDKLEKILAAIVKFLSDIMPLILKLIDLFS